MKNLKAICPVLRILGCDVGCAQCTRPTEPCKIKALIETGELEIHVSRITDEVDREFGIVEIDFNGCSNSRTI